MQAISPVRQRFGRENPVQVVAHRGLQIDLAPDLRTGDVYVENTLLAFTEAAERGIPAAETDLITSFLHHDDRPGRVFHFPEGIEWVKEMPLKRLGEVRLNPEGIRQTIEPKLTGISPMPVLRYVLEDSCIPNLEQVLKAIRKINPNFHLYVEIKTTDDPPFPSDTKGAEENLVQLVQQYGLYNNVTAISFNPWSLRKIQRLDGKIKTGLDVVLEKYYQHIDLPGFMRWAQEDLGVQTVLPPYQEITQQVVDVAHQWKLKIMPWVWKETVLEELKRADELVGMGVDGIITNIAGMMQRHLNDRP